MDVQKILIREEKKLLAVANKVGAKLSQIRAAINALGTNSKPHARGAKLRGRKLSLKHRRAIKAGGEGVILVSRTTTFVAHRSGPVVRRLSKMANSPQDDGLSLDAR